MTTNENSSPENPSFKNVNLVFGYTTATVPVELGEGMDSDAVVALAAQRLGNDIGGDVDSVIDAVQSVQVDGADIE
jgi:hypothetical protein